MKISRHFGLRTIGWAAAYVLALHTMLFGLAATPSLHAASAGSLVVELCLTGGTDADTAPGHSTGDHCTGCFDAGGALPPMAASPHPVTYAFAAAAGVTAAAALPHTALHGRPGLPRAPPRLLA